MRCPTYPVISRCSAAEPNENVARPTRIAPKRRISLSTAASSAGVPERSFSTIDSVATAMT